MTARQTALQAYFALVVPAAGGVLVAAGTELLLDLPGLFALAAGVLFAVAAFLLGKVAAANVPPGGASSACVRGTILIACVPVATGLAYFLTARYGSLPPLLVGAGVGIGSWFAVLLALAVREPFAAEGHVERGEDQIDLDDYARRYNNRR